MRNDKLQMTNDKLIFKSQTIWKFGFWISFGFCLPAIVLTVAGILTFGFPAAFGEDLLESTLKAGIGVRPLAMGGAFTALADDSSAVFYNPAGLGSIANASYSRGYLDWNGETYKTSDYYSLVFTSFGLSSWRQVNLTGEALEVTNISYGVTGDNGISWGVNYKVVRGNLVSGTKNGYSFDLGLKGKADPKLSWGLMAYDLMETNINIPASLRFGLAYKLSPQVLLAADVEGRHLKNDPSYFAHYGAEAQVTDGLKLRGGWQYDQYTFGAVLTFPFITLDYGLSAGAKGNAVHRIAFGFGED